MVLMGRPESVSADVAMAGLVAFRVIYYLVPLGLVAVGLAGFEVRRQRVRVAGWSKSAGRWLPTIAPRVLAVSTFVAGGCCCFQGPLHRCKAGSRG